MNKLLKFLFILLSFAGVSPIHAVTFPKPTGLVNDFAGVLSPEEKQNLEKTLADYREKTTIEFAVVTIPSLEELQVEDYANQLFHTWGIGQKGKDNGILLLVAPNEKPRGKVRIEVGYGLEQYLTDAMSGDIIRNSIVPGWRSVHRADGIITGVQAIINKLRERMQASQSKQTGQKQEPDDEEFYILIVGIIVLSIAAVIGLVMWFKREPDEDDKSDTIPESDPRMSGPVREFDYSRRSGRSVGSTYIVPVLPSGKRDNDSSSTRRKPDDDDDSSTSSSISSSSDSGSGSFGGFGGGDSGGGGASGDL